MQGWFAGPSSKGQDKDEVSVLADWNSYAARKEADEGSLSSVASAAAMDLEAGLSSAGSTLVGAFSSVTKGMRDLPSSVSSAATYVPSRQSIMSFSVMIGSGVFFIMLAFTVFLPMIIVAPQKFAICFTLGCIFIMGAFFALKGPKSQALHMISKERLPFTLGFLGSMCATLYASMVLHSYIFSVFFSGIQVLALLYYVISYFPGGSAGLQFITSFFTSAVMKCCSR
ncbi:uncharacterized protein [Physcomitrium patens]|uniref:Vesicle transport protein n=1 Tax=Physcomitrium patens TaxID=3218 RepID=A0A2K1IUL5_PHYPA|nr:protein transport protein SFT2-like [Physcomitrium patens]PNR32960.1 hypothetical protein PHYPA_024903 [Physcomitrium patens]|eukprot:XP_024356992.1 protein transport protein SFT2-like [Physcomitrella patens]